MKNLLNLLQRAGKRLGPAQSKGHRAIVTSGAVVSVLLLVIGARLSQSLAPADVPSLASEEEVATRVLLNPIRVGSEPTSPELAQQQAAAVFSIMNPDIVSRELMKDPAVVKSVEETSVYILTPRLVEAEMEKDPEFRKRRAAAFGAEK